MVGLALSSHHSEDTVRVTCHSVPPRCSAQQVQFYILSYCRICLALSRYTRMPHFAFKMCHFTPPTDIQLSLPTHFMSHDYLPCWISVRATFASKRYDTSSCRDIHPHKYSHCYIRIPEHKCWPQRWKYGYQNLEN